MRKALSSSLVSLLLLSVPALALPVPALAGDAPSQPFPQHVRYAAGTLRPSHRTQAQQDDDVRAAYARWKASYLAQAGTEGDGHPRYRVKLEVAAGAATVSEGQGYGMMIVAYMAGHDGDARTVFDGLWEFFNDHRSTIDSRLMDWNVPADEASQGGDDSAFDGDCDIAFALLLAERQWGNGGRVDYGAQAAGVIAGILASTIGPQSRLPMLGDWVDPGGAVHNQYTPRSSDFIPDHFRAFRRATGDPAWDAVVAASQQVIASLHEGYSPATGLLPDFIVPASAVDATPKPAPAGFLEGANDGKYYYNAGRDPWRLATDALVHGDPASRTAALAMASWARSSTGAVVADLAAGYELNGTPLAGSDYFSTFFVAPFGVAAMLDPGGQTWLNAVYDAVRGEEQGYFEDTVTLLCLLVMTGNYWDPILIFADGFESGDTTRWSGQG